MPPTTINLDEIKSRSWMTTLSYDVSSIIIYNLALGPAGSDLSLCFEGSPDFHALPTFGTLPVISAMSAVTKSMPEMFPNFQPHNHVHGEHYLELKRPFPIPQIGEKVMLRTTAKILEVVDWRSGVTVSVGIWTSDSGSGEGICYNEWMSFLMRVPGEGASAKAEDRRAMSRTYPSPDREPDAVIDQKTSLE